MWRINVGIGLCLAMLLGCQDMQQRQHTTPPKVTAMSKPSVPTDARRTEREQLVNIIAKHPSAGSTLSEATLNALRAVPRHHFIPKAYHAHAYEDRPLPIGHEVTISQPFVVAHMTDLMSIEEGDKVLEVGTGSGYQAAVLAELTPHVFTIEIIEPLAERAAQTLQQLGYATIRTRVGDGYAGWPEEAPFDAIIVTAAAPRIPPALIEQLAPGGHLVLPVGPPHHIQSLDVVTKDKKGDISIERIAKVRFVPMTGTIQTD